ncbi:hypothetical protein, partial [Bradyrhizobium sp. Bra64]|uniref:hypothetical protein n=1 Tax=Bradyrhizobium sp. Bra64 TaxID=2926009 RepID=UPI002119B259
QWTAGASRHPVFPAPSFIWGEGDEAKLGRTGREDAKACLQLKIRNEKSDGVAPHSVIARNDEVDAAGSLSLRRRPGEGRDDTVC